MTPEWTFLEAGTAELGVAGAMRGLVESREQDPLPYQVFFSSLGIRRAAAVVERGGPPLDGGPSVGDEVLCLFEEEQDRCHIIGWRAPDHTETRRIHLPGGVVLDYDGNGRIRLEGRRGSWVDFDDRAGTIALKAVSNVTIESETGDVHLKAPQGQVVLGGEGPDQQLAPGSVHLQSSSSLKLTGPRAELEFTPAGGVRLEAQDQLFCRSQEELTLCSGAPLLIYSQDEARLAAAGDTYVRSGGETLYLDAAGDLRTRVEERLMLHAREHATLQSVEGRVNVVSEEHLSINAREGDIIQEGQKIRLN